MNMKKNLAWNTFGSIFYSMCQWVITIIVVYVADYGVAGYLSLAMTMSSSFSAISLFSMRNYQVSDVKGEFTTGQYVSSRVWTCLGALVCCMAWAFWREDIYQFLCVLAFMLVRVAEGMVDVFHGINQRYDRYDYIGISYVIRGFLTVAVFSLGLMVCGNLCLVLFAVAGCNLLVMLVWDLVRTAHLEHWKLKIMDRRIVRLLLCCAPLVVFSFLLSWQNLYAKELVQEYYGREALGIYSTIASPTLIVQLCASVVFNPFLPRFAQIYHDGKREEFLRLLHRTYALLAGFGLVVIAGAMILGRWGLALLFPDDILAHYELFMPMVYCTILVGYVWVLSAIVIMLRRMLWLLLGMVCELGVLLAVARHMMTSLGINGASYAQVVALPVLIVIMMLICEVQGRRKNCPGNPV